MGQLFGWKDRPKRQKITDGFSETLKLWIRPILLSYWGFRKNLQAILVTFFSFSFHQTYLDPYMDGKLMSLRVSWRIPFFDLALLKANFKKRPVSECFEGPERGSFGSLVSHAHSELEFHKLQKWNLLGFSFTLIRGCGGSFVRKKILWGIFWNPSSASGTF